MIDISCVMKKRDSSAYEGCSNPFKWHLVHLLQITWDVKLTNKKGEIFYCVLCGANAQHVYELDYVFRCPNVSLQQLILQGPCGEANSIAKSNKPLQGLKKKLIRESNARPINEGEKKKKLKKILKAGLHGVQKVPALCFPSLSENLKSIDCANYAILGFQSLCDIGRYMETCLLSSLTMYQAMKLLN